jgi:molecular chaperone DnaJ
MFRRGFLSVAQTCPTCGGAGRVTTSPCGACTGRGRVEREASLKVTVPAGVDTGMRLRLAGEGEDGMLGGPRGDLYVVVAVAEHDRFVRHGDDLHLALPVSSFQAMLGTRMTIDTILRDDAEIEVPAGAQPDQTLRLRGAGMPRLDGRGTGDLIVHVKVVVPRKLTAEQRRLLEEAARLGDEPVVVDDEPGILQRIKRALTGDD